MSGILKRFPDRTQILPVYAVIVFIVYAWSLLWFFWQLPGWLYFLSVGNVLSALTYVLVMNLVESIVVLGGLLALALILPSQWFRDVFIARGATLSIAGLGYMMFLAERFKDMLSYPDLPLAAWTVPAAMVVIVLIAYAGGRFGALRGAVENIADRVTIFVYLFIPASILSLISITVRMFTR